MKNKAFLEIRKKTRMSILYTGSSKNKSPKKSMTQ
jgi:hypothetical protein